MSDGQIVIEVIMDDKSVRSGTAKIDSSIGSLSRSGERASLSIGKIATSIGLVKVAGKAFDLLKSSVGSAVDRFDTLQKFPKVMESLGYSTEQSAKSSKKLSDGIEGLPTTLQDVVAHTQQMTSITGDLDKSTDTVLALNNAFLASGASTADAERGMQQYNQMLSTGQVDLMSWRTLQETMPLALQKTAEAMGFVGKSAQTDLYNALKNGTVTFDQFQDKLIQLGTGTGMLADLAKKNSLGIKTSFVNLRNSITKGLANVLTKFDEVIQKLTGKSIAQNIDSLKGIINKIFNDITANVYKVIPTLENLKNLFVGVYNELSEHWTLIAPILAGVAAGFAVFGAITISIWVYNTAISIAATVTGAFTAALAFLLSPIGLIVIAIGTLVAIGTALYMNWTTIKESAISIWTTISDFFSTVLNAIGTFFLNSWATISLFLSQTWGNISSAASSIWSSIGSFIENIIESISNNITTVWNTILGFLTSIFNKISSNVFTVWNGIFDFLRGLVNGIWNIMNSVFSSILNIVTTIWNNIKSAISMPIEAAKNTVMSVVDSIKRVLMSIANINLFDAGKAIINGFLKGLKSAFKEVKDFVGGIADWISKHKGPISYDKKLLITHGQAIMQSLNNGLVNGFQQVQDTISGIASELSDGVNVGLNVRASDNLLSLPKITPEAALGAYGQMASTSSIVNNYYTTRNNDGVHYQRPIIIENTVELDGRSLAKGTAKFTDEEIRRTTKLQNKIKGV
ncbi:tape measure protein [Enterococcus faecalis]